MTRKHYLDRVTMLDYALEGLRLVRGLNSGQFTDEEEDELAAHEEQLRLKQEAALRAAARRERGAT